ncbi:MAG: hypothetical protein GEU75_15040 [Dehalococcoidia bacterium]|nr:hypothetical protein [Dehalococcoidia bacterium]
MSFPGWADEVTFHIDPETMLPHVYNHDVTEDEAEQVLRSPLEVRYGYEGALIAFGRTLDGRIMRVVYGARNDSLSSIITAFQLSGKPLAAFRRRIRRQRRQ